MRIVTRIPKFICAQYPLCMRRIISIIITSSILLPPPTTIVARFSRVHTHSQKVNAMVKSAEMFVVISLLYVSIVCAHTNFDGQPYCYSFGGDQNICVLPCIQRRFNESVIQHVRAYARRRYFPIWKGEISRHLWRGNTQNMHICTPIIILSAAAHVCVLVRSKPVTVQSQARTHCTDVRCRAHALAHILHMFNIFPEQRNHCGAERATLSAGGWNVQRRRQRTDRTHMCMGVNVPFYVLPHSFMISGRRCPHPIRRPAP